MSHHLSVEALQLIKELTGKVVDVEEDTDVFKHVHDHIVTALSAADSMYFMNKKQIDCNIEGLSEKFAFHGFCAQANDLRRLYDRYVPNGAPKEDLEAKMNVVKFLLCLSESPTNNFKSNASAFVPFEEEEVVDWPAYLKEGIERWSPPVGGESDWSDESNSDSSSHVDESDVVDVAHLFNSNVTNVSPKLAPTERMEPKRDIMNECVAVKEKLCSSIQNNWFNENKVQHFPESNHVDATVAFRWDDFLSQCTGGLVELERCNVVSEYKIMREVIWQLYAPHSSFCYEFVGDVLVPRENATVSSVRPGPFGTFMREFLPYIEVLEVFRNFRDSLGDETDVKPPETYRSYDWALHNMINPVYEKFLELEDEIREQDSMMSLLVLAKRLREIFKNVLTVKGIHDLVLIDHKANSPLLCSTTLLSRLHVGLLHCTSKTEQDIYLTLYLETLFKYLDIVNSWLNKGVFFDHAGEFVILDNNPKDSHSYLNCSYKKSFANGSFVNARVEMGDPDWQMEFEVRELDDFCRNDSVLSAIATDVFQIGKNLHLLRLLRKLDCVDSLSNDSIYEELIARVLQEIAAYFRNETVLEKFADDEYVDAQSPAYKFPICPEYCKYPTEMDRLENLVDTSDGFLMSAFESYYVETPRRTPCKETPLFEKISSLTGNIFPAAKIVDDVFAKILKERYSKLGYAVKNVLMHDYDVYRHLRMLRNLFLFEDNLVVPLYQRMFVQFESEKNWGNEIWLTGHLHDILMDAYPRFYKKATIKVGQYWEQCLDPVEVCEMISVQYRIKWPINVLIRNEHMKMYGDIFGVILKIKWAIFVLNRLHFTEILGTKLQKQQKTTAALIKRMHVLRFSLSYEFTAIQHYIFGLVVHSGENKLQSDFDRAYNLDTLIACHDEFINSVHSAVISIGGCLEFKKLLPVVTKLKMMWKDLRNVEDNYLKVEWELYKNCHEKLKSIMRDVSFDV